MMVSRFAIAVSILSLALGPAGCGRSTPSAVPSSPEATESGPSAADAPERATLDPSDSPEAAVTQLARGLERNRPQTLWNALPASYQNDVNQLVRDAARRVDPEIWNRSVEMARRTTALLASRREFILQHPALAENPALDPDDLAASWDGLVGLLETLVASDLARLDRLAAFDGGAFLSSTGAALMTQISELSEQAGEESPAARLRRQFRSLDVTLVKREGDTAVLRIDTGDPDVPPRDREYVRVEGKWIPRDLADSWKPTMTSLRAGMDRFLAADALTESRETTLATLGRIEKTLDALEAAPDAERFLTIFNTQVVAPLAMAGQRGAPNATVADSQPRPAGADGDPDSSTAATAEPDPRITVVVNAILDEAGRDVWQERLAAATDTPSIGLALPSGDGAATRFEVTPVADVRAFAERLRHGTVMRVDEAQRTVAIDP